jgi:hypothetical protein
LLIPATWLLSRRPKPYPFLADFGLRKWRVSCAYCECPA